MIVDRKILQQQIAFYRARAREYGQSPATREQLETVKQSLRTLGPFADVIELACGTGLWTRELVNIGRAITAVDASPEMIEINRRYVDSSRVTYQEADLFAWEPDRHYDFLFTAFWLSHVPPDLMDGFLDKIRRSVRSGGRALIVDQCDDIRDEPRRERAEIYEKRRVGDGRQFTIVKVYYHPGLLADKLGQFDFDTNAQSIGESFFSILGQKR